MKHLTRYRSILIYILFFLLMVATISLKENYHVDETYTYGLSNNKEGIKIQFSDGEKYNPSVVYADYLTVDNDNRFSYDIVWQNQENDVHPPLYYAILHTICSFFPGVFSKSFAGIINIFFALGTLFVLRKIIPFFLNDKIHCELLSFSFIVSSGVLSATSFFRMYIMAMFWVTLLTYLYIREIGQDTIKVSFFIATYVVTLLAALTHYYCIVFAVLISFVYGMYLLVRKKWRKTILFCVSMGMAGCSAYSIFPPMIKHMFSGYRGKQALSALEDSSNLWNGMKLYFGFLDRQMFGGFLGYILVILLFCFLLFIVTKTFLKDNFYNTGNNCTPIQGYELIRYCLIWIPSAMYFVIVSKISPYQADRYLVPIYGVAFIGILCSVSRLAASIFSTRNTLLFACIILGIISAGSWENADWPYLYQDSKAFLEEASCYQNVNCICIYDVNWKVQSAFLEAQQYKSIMFASKDNLELINNLEDTYKDTELVLMIVGDCDNDTYISDFLERSESMSNSRVIGGFAYGTSYYLYQDE